MNYWTNQLSINYTNLNNKLLLFVLVFKYTVLYLKYIYN